MPRPALRTSEGKRRAVRLPGGGVGYHSKVKHVGIGKCAACGRRLKGVGKLDVRNRYLPKTDKRPERLYGGCVCSSCLREWIKQACRGFS
ncbi:50S ribosomal protein L34e [Candidatus Bathyarchaeota archaeon]|nr:50S ribosomal protein L34e [Candidatus Bathyarchaeota archaeon]